MLFTIAFNLIYIKMHSPVTEKPRLIILGDSHTMTINPEIFSSSINISQSAESPLISYIKLSKILKHHKPDTIILGFSHHSISGFNDLKFSDPIWADEMFSRLYSILTPDDLMGLPYDSKSWQQSIFLNVLLYPHTDHFRYIGKFIYGNSTYKLDATPIINRHFYKQNELLDISKVSIRSIELFAELCEQHNIKLFLLSTPVHSSYYKLIPSIIKERFESEKIRMMQLGICMLDYSTIHLQDSLFMDANHLNGIGSTLFSKQLKNDLGKNKCLNELCH
jgi:hypothetical protein